MMRTLLLGFVVACSSKDATPSSSSTKSPAAPLPSKLDCSNILSPDIRTKYFATAELQDHPETISNTGECAVRTKDGKVGALTVSCHGKLGGELGPSIKVLKGSVPNVQDLPGVGRAALTSHDPQQTYVQAWDDDSNCDITMRLPNVIDAVALAKDLVAYLPPK